jgi:hypothetical protein
MRDHESDTAEQKKTSRMAIASLVLALGGGCLFIVMPLLAISLAFDMTGVMHPLLLNLLWLLSIGLGVSALVVIRSKRLKGRVLAISGIVLSALQIVFVMWLMLTIFPNEVTKVSKYEEIRHELWHNPKLVAHFPDKIPADANDIRLSYLPGGLQGGAWFQVKMTLPEDRISQLFEEFDLKKVKSFQGGGSHDHENSEGGMPTTLFRTSESDSRDSSENFVGERFPEDFVIMVLGTSGNWHHGKSQGVAMSKARNQIVYWADDW